jgi:hypothetical protein
MRFVDPVHLRVPTTNLSKNKQRQEQPAMSKFREALNSWGSTVIGLILVFGAAHAVNRWIAPRPQAGTQQTAPGSSAQDTTSQAGETIDGFRVMQCPEPIEVSNCRVEPGMLTPTCTFRNVAQAPLGPLRVWSYDADGVLTGDFALEVANLAPGQRKRAQVFSLSMGRDKTLVVCSMDPESPVVRDRLQVVGSAPQNDARQQTIQPAPTALAVAAPTPAPNAEHDAAKSRCVQQAKTQGYRNGQCAFSFIDTCIRTQSREAMEAVLRTDAMLGMNTPGTCPNMPSSYAADFDRF